MKQYQNLQEIIEDLYAVQSYFKNHVAFDAESEILDDLRNRLIAKERLRN